MMNTHFKRLLVWLAIVMLISYLSAAIISGTLLLNEMPVIVRIRMIAFGIIGYVMSLLFYPIVFDLDDEE
jgi:hypothetical protein